MRRKILTRTGDGKRRIKSERAALQTNEWYQYNLGIRFFFKYLEGTSPLTIYFHTFLTQTRRGIGFGKEDSL